MGGRGRGRMYQLHSFAKYEDDVLVEDEARVCYEEVAEHYVEERDAADYCVGGYDGHGAGCGVSIGTRQDSGGCCKLEEYSCVCSRASGRVDGEVLGSR